MQRTTILGTTIAVLGLLSADPSAFAQFEDGSRSVTPSPRSNVGGYAGQELRTLYRESIGRGYTIQDQNNLSLQGTRSFVPYVGQATTPSGLNNRRVETVNQRIDLGISSSNTQKPFANVTSRPAVSPYMNLFREDFDGGGDFNYQTLVQPQLQQQRLNQQFQDQAQAISRRVQQISAQPAYNPAGSQSQYPTGHQTVFGYYGRFYPKMSTGR
jgi:hypothetical protein